MSARGPGRWQRRGIQLAAAAAVAVAIAGLVIAGRVARRVEADLQPPRQRGAPVALPGVRSVSFETSDGVRIAGSYIPSRNGAAIVFGHGHGAERSQFLPEAAALTRHGFGALLFDWRAHGESGGSRSTWGITEQRDLDAAIDFVAAQADVGGQGIGVLGFSMGAMVVTEVAARDQRIRAVAMEGAFTSLEEMIRFDERKWGWLGQSVAVRALRGNGIDVRSVRTEEAICRLAPRPVLVIGGGADAAVPVSITRRLAAAACGPASILIIPRAAHTSYARVGGTALEARLVSFFDDALVAGQSVQARAAALPPSQPSRRR